MANLIDTIVIRLAGEEIILRPSLRYAMRLERLRGGFATLTKGVMDGSLSAAVEIIRDHYEHPFLENQVLEALDMLKGPLLDYLGACLGVDPDDKSGKTSNAKTEAVAFAEYLTSLYRIGTGWLGWTPAETLYATPAEIKEAYRGRMEMLKAIFGSGDGKDKADTPASPDQLTAKMKFIFRARAATKMGGA